MDLQNLHFHTKTENILTIHAWCLYCPYELVCFSGGHFADPVMSQLKQWCLYIKNTNCVGTAAIAS